MFTYCNSLNEDQARVMSALILCARLCFLTRFQERLTLAFYHCHIETHHKLFKFDHIRFTALTFIYVPRRIPVGPLILRGHLPSRT